MTAPNRISVNWTKAGKAVVGVPASYGPAFNKAGIYILEAPNAPDLLAALRDAKDGLAWARHHLKQHGIVSTAVESAHNEVCAAISKAEGRA